MSLAQIRQILGVHEERRPSHPLLYQKAYGRVAHTDSSVRIIVKALTPGIENLKAHAGSDFVFLERDVQAR